MHSSRSSVLLDALAKSVRRPRQRRIRLPKDLLPSLPPACEHEKMMPKSVARVLGPYPNGPKWRLVLLDGASRKALLADTREAALKLRENLLGQIKSHTYRTIGEALEEYLGALAARDVITVDKIRRMLRLFLPLDELLSAISPERAEQMYLAETQRTKPNGQPIAADTHHLVLRRSKQFYKWALARRYVDRNPFAEVRPIGRPRLGKPQLRIDEARRLVDCALVQAQKLDVGSTAALIQIFLGLRPTESMIRVVRDLDDQGRVLWVPFGKTRNARRRLQVPEVLRELLLRHAQGKSADAPLLGPPGERMHTRHTLCHRLKQLCEEAKVPRVCPHSLRGLNATLALDAGATAHQVAAALGHASFSITARHYADASTVANAGLRKVAEVLTSQGAKSLDVQELANLIFAQLTAEQICSLRKKLGE